MRAALLTTFVTWAALSGVASAQTEITTTVRDFPNRAAGTFDLMDLATVAANPVGAAECDTMITFRFSNIDTMRAQLQFFEGSNCDDVAVRTNTTSTECEPLPVPSVAVDGHSQIDIAIRAGDLVPCDAGTGSGVEDIWVLAVDNESSEVTGAGQQDQFDVAFDLSPPSGPGGFTADGGENSVTISWDPSSEQVTTYEVYLDPAGCTDGTYTGTALADPLSPDPAALFTEFMGPASDYMLVWPDTVPIGSEAGIAIRAIDSSNNPGPLSTVVCVERIEVVSWRDRYCMENPGACDSSGGCSAVPGTSRDPLAPIALLALLALLWRIRR